ncbi:MAG: hypothetical protein R6U52_05885 [Kosmotogaceae bacterium]
MKKILFVLIVAFLLTIVSFSGMAQDTPEVLSYYVISEPWIVGLGATAIAIEYNRDLDVAFDLKNHFTVNVELKELDSFHGIPLPQTAYPKAPRTITAAYTSNVPEVGVVMPGRYVILELSPLDPHSWSYCTTVRRNTLDPDRSRGYNNGRELLPYGENMVVEIEQLSELKYSLGGAARGDVSVETTEAEFTGTDFEFERRGEWAVIADDFVPHKSLLQRKMSLKCVCKGQQI